MLQENTQTKGALKTDELNFFYSHERIPEEDCMRKIRGGGRM